MSDWANDIAMMHHKFGVRQWFEENKSNKELMDKYLRFRHKSSWIIILIIGIKL